MVVRSEEPGVVQAASQRINELVEAGVVLVSGQEYGVGGPTYIFRGLNSIKPEMIADATARAREATVEFARDSNSRLGGIRRANQGVFQILPLRSRARRRRAEPHRKTVRIVSTVEYYLRD